MQTRILDCPKCGGRFEFESDAIPSEITCPTCRETSAAGDYSAIMLCPACHKKLTVPLPLLNEPELICPLCDQTFSTAESIRLSELGTDTTLSDVKEEDLLPRESLKEGDIFDKFQIVRLLGRGGMAEVYLAEHLLFRRPCALKLLIGANVDPVTQKRFVREAKISNGISHPNIVKVFDIGADAKTGRLFIAMEYVDGVTLSSEARQAPFTEAALREVLSAMTEALSELEAHKIVHRDIKPSNIMRTRDGMLKLMDLGIAKTESDAASGELTLTVTQSVIGTPGFASPEQSQSAHDTDTRSDIFSLGATLYFLATGRHPFDGKTAIEIILNVMRKEPVPLDTLRPDLSPGMRALIRKMMAKSPDDRPQNTASLRQAIAEIDEVQDAGPKSFASPRLTSRVELSASGEKPNLIPLKPPVTNLPKLKRNKPKPPETPPPPPEPKKSRKGLWVAILLVIAGIGGFFCWRAVPSASAPPPPAAPAAEVKQTPPAPAPKPEPEPQPAPKQEAAPKETAAKPAEPAKQVVSVQTAMESEARTKEQKPEEVLPKFVACDTMTQRLEASLARQKQLEACQSSERVKLMRDFCARQIEMQKTVLQRIDFAQKRPPVKYPARYNAQMKAKIEAYLKKNQHTVPHGDPFINELMTGLKTKRLDLQLSISDDGGHLKTYYKGPPKSEFTFFELLITGRFRPRYELLAVAVRQGADLNKISLDLPFLASRAADTTFFWWEYGPDKLPVKYFSDFASLTQKRFVYEMWYRTDRKKYYGGTMWDLPRFRSLLLCGGLDPDFAFEEKDNLLHMAVDMGDLAMVRDVIGAGFTKFREPDASGDTPYIKALYGGHSDIAKCLEACGMATPISKENEIQIAFFNAVWKRDPAAIKEAIAQGADPNHIMRRGLTALQYGCMTRQLSMVKTLLDAGVPPTAVQRPFFQVNHPLVLAAINDSLPIFKLILQCAPRSYMDIVKYDWFHPRPVVFALIERFTTRTGDLIPYFDVLFKIGLDPNIVDKDMPKNISPEATLLVEAVWTHRRPDTGKFARYLIQKGAKTDKIYRGKPLSVKLKIILAK